MLENSSTYPDGVPNSRRNCHPEEPKATVDLGSWSNQQMQGFFAEFTLSEMLRSFALLRMTGEGLRMTRWERYSAAT